MNRPSEADSGNWLQNILLARTKNTYVQFFRYFFVGGVATLFHWGTYVALTELTVLHYLIGNIIAFIVGISVNFIISILWVFGPASVSRRKEIAIFVIIGLIGLGFSEFFLWFFGSFLGMNQIKPMGYMIPQAISTLLVLFWNFIARKRILYNT